MNKTPIILFFNNKGGVGKTTCSLNETAALAMKGKTVLVIDMDDSMNFTFHMRAKKSSEKAFPVSSLLTDPRIEIQDCILWDTKIENVGLIASDHKISDTINSKVMGNRESHIAMAKRFSQSLNALDGEFDYIIIDVSPSMDAVVSLALMVATHLIFVSDCNAYSEQGIVNLLKSDEMKFVSQVNPKQVWVGMLYNKIDMRKTIARMLVNRASLDCGIAVLPVYIPDRNEIDVNSFTQDFAVSKDKKSIISESFEALADYIIENVNFNSTIDQPNDNDILIAKEA